MRERGGNVVSYEGTRWKCGVIRGNEVEMWCHMRERGGNVVSYEGTRWKSGVIWVGARWKCGVI